MKVTIGYTLHLEPHEMQTIREGLSCELDSPSKLLSDIDREVISAADAIQSAHGSVPKRKSQKF